MNAVSNVRTLSPMTDEQIGLRAPAALAAAPHAAVSRQYRQVKTLEVINIMRDQGWAPVQAFQGKVRELDRRDFSKHMIRFSRVDQPQALTVGDNVIQAVLTNSHDRSSAFIFALGVFRLVCGNGMMVSQGSFSAIHIRHVGFDPRNVVQASAKIADHGVEVIDRIGAMQNIQLEEREQLALASSASELMLEPGEGIIDPRALLATRRSADNRPDLWTTFNRIQENVIRGGLRYHRRNDNGPQVIDIAPGANARRVIPRRFSIARTRPVQSIDRDVKLNQALWSLTEKMREIKSGG